MSWRSSRAADLIDLDRRHHPDPGDPGGLLRRAVLMADAEGNVEVAAKARQELIQRASDYGLGFDLLASFGWLIARARKKPEEVSPSSLMWVYKWAVANMDQVVGIPADAIYSIIDDLERDYADRGLSTAAALQLRLSSAIAMRHQDLLPGYFEAWSRNESGSGSDCDACRRDVRVHYFNAMDEHERAIVEAGPILDGRMTCAEIPQLTYRIIVDSLLRLRRFSDALKNCRLGIKTLKPHDLRFGVGVYLVCLSANQCFDPATKLFASRMRVAMRTHDDRARFEYWRGGRILFRSLDRAGRRSVYLTLPPGFERFERDGTYDVQAMAELCEQKAEALAARFDARNGNPSYQQSLTDDTGLLEESG